MTDKQQTIWELVIAPAVVGIVVLIGQFFIQPVIAKRSQENITRWESRRTAYMNAVDVLHRHLDSQVPVGSVLAHQLGDKYPRSQHPTQEEVNKAYIAILCQTEGTEIPRLFRAIMENNVTSNTVRYSDYLRFISLVRHELGYGRVKYEREDATLFKMP